MFEKLPGNELQMIKKYITTYVGEEPTCSLEHLLRHWNSKKEDLFTLLGDNFMVTKEIEYLQPIEEIIKQLDNKIVNLKAVYNFNHFITYSSITAIQENRWLLRSLIDSIVLAKNKYNYETIKIEDNITIPQGIKPLKALSKLNKVYHFCTDKELEELRIIHSQALNQKKIKGKLTLSIHPFDFMTMSDNDCGWSSCMSWKNDGCYRMGTVEMMNSPIVIMAYLTTDNNSMQLDFFGDKIWNSKKWRQLFVVNKELITSVKAYPYQNDFLTKEVIKFIAELAKNNWDIEYHVDTLLNYDSSDYNFNFYTDYMYNDFGTTDHYIALADLNKTSYDINYSGMAECMTCGNTHNFPDFTEESNFLQCQDCGDYCLCDWCGELLHGNEEHYHLNGYTTYCGYCYEQHAAREFGTDEIKLREDLDYLYIYNSDGVNKKLVYYSDVFNRFLNEDVVIHTQERSYHWTERFVYYDELLPEWQDYFDTYDYLDI